MRCHYCGIRLKIAENGQMIEHCPECSMRGEYESRQDFTVAQRENYASLNTGRDNRPRLFAATTSASGAKARSLL